MLLRLLLGVANNQAKNHEKRVMKQMSRNGLEPSLAIIKWMTNTISTGTALMGRYIAQG